ncbi:MAG TPA: hypothetical protein VGH87_06365 [Polyangiaceae bacterium]
MKGNSCTNDPSFVVDDLRVYSNAITTTQLDSDVGTIACNTAGLVAYFKFDEGSGTSAVDCTASKFSITLGSPATFVSSPFP